MAEDGTQRIDAARLRSFIVRMFIAIGMSEANAVIVAEAMVEADLIGSDAHGCFRLGQYISQIKTGEINPRPQITVERAKATALLDGDRGLGHLTMTRAADLAAELAGDFGIGWVGLRRSNHAGAIGNYAANLAKRGMIAICAAVSGVNQMGPSGSAEALIGTNPIAIAIPAGEEPPFVLDIATANVAFGKVKSARLEGKPLGANWMIDRETGEPLTDAELVHRGLMTAMGDYKGMGLSMALGMLAGVLNGAAFGREVPDFAAPGSPQSRNTGQFVMALDIEAFRPLAAFTGDIDRHMRDFTGSKRLPGHYGVRLPGRERVVRRAERLRNGIPVSTARIAQFDMLADSLGVTRLLG
ncbi:MAG TPA: Ldh family oxidoreductase [Stellaceae bacterium]|jgi:LDH2 family malate/lactate/ureidoglycolate dehydrogenase|nr:Ldh family oxidoreductase [Stellaceae bacterium]